MKTNHILLSVFLVLALLLSGCANYKVGTPGQESTRTLYIEQVVNRSYAPQVRALLTEELHQVFLRDGAYHLTDNAATADLILDVTISDYSREGVASREDDTGRALSFDLYMFARLNLRDGKGNYLLEERVLEADATVYATSGLPTAEHGNMPVLVKELARRIRDTVDGTW
jgi:hypothetical protein